MIIAIFSLIPCPSRGATTEHCTQDSAAFGGDPTPSSSLPTSNTTHPATMLSKSVFLKHFSLVVLVLQNTVLVLVMRYSRTVTVDGLKYLPTTAVVMSELLKLVTCGLMVFQGTDWDIARTATQLYTEIVQKRSEMAKIAIPSILYTFQNNLLYLALTYLDAATFQVISILQPANHKI